MKRIKYIYVVLIVVLIYACYKPNINTTSYKSGAYDFSSLYNPGEVALHPDYRIYINTDTSAAFFFSIDINELKKVQEKIDENKLKLNIKYVLRDFENNQIVDSNLNVFLITPEANQIKFSAYFNVKIPDKKKYRLVTAFWGESPNDVKRTLSFIDNSTTLSGDYFLLKKTDNNSNETVYHNYVNLTDPYTIQSIKKEKIDIEYYKSPSYTVRPPYSTFVPAVPTSEPDSLFEYKLGDTIYFTQKGIYLLKDKSAKKASLCLLSAGNSFPDIQTLGDMMEPLKLITTNKEYTKIKESDNIKKAIDDFWITRSNNQKFAKEQIRVFYSRVKLANIYFSENIEGWKTDRGNIYIMFGPPSTVNISDTYEEWLYGEDPNVAALSFVFEKKENSFLLTTYQLIRDNMYQPTWAQALSTWRKGRVFAI
ncbi:MAG: GWxTD domain-containing protein [Bacteroidales bacterium]|jgi:GWxTD domain-containing protein|nr:GWxTD domain-containing protein [Bacteroidales bacterium]